MKSLRSRDTVMSRRSAISLGIGVSAAASLGLSARPARAARKIRLTTNFFAEPSMGGMYQALATGLYAARGLDVEIRQGGPQINGLQLLTGGETDFVVSSAMGAYSAYDNGAPILVVAASFQSDPQCLVARPTVRSLVDLRGHKILVSTQGRASYWVWLEKRFGFTDDQAFPYTGNIQPFVTDPTIALGGLISSEPYRIKSAGVDVKSFLLADEGYPPYGSPILAMRAFVDQNKETVATFVKATMAGWKSFLDNPAPGLSIIQSVNQKADDGWVRYSVDTIRRLGLVTGGEAKTRGIGTMNDERWKTLADFMIDAGLLKSGRPTKDLYTLDFANAADIIP